MEAKFTKGPWHKSGWKSAEVSIGIPGAEKIEIRSAAPTWGVASVYIIRDSDREIQEANAALIVAAPKLYDAAEEILPDIESEIEQRKYSGNDEDWRDLERKANALRAALAEARGKTDLGKAA